MGRPGRGRTSDKWEGLRQACAWKLHGTGRQNRSERPLGNGQQDTHPGTHEARSSSFTRNTLKIKEECERARFFCPGALAEHPSC